MTGNLGKVGTLCLLGGGVAWLVVLVLLDNTDFDSSAVILAVLGTLAVVLPGVMLLGVVAFIVGAAIRDASDDRFEVEKDLRELKAATSPES